MGLRKLWQCQDPIGNGNRRQVGWKLCGIDMFESHSPVVFIQVLISSLRAAGSKNNSPSLREIGNIENI